ncbi:energy-coupling factor transporter transmembrane component T [Streptomyces sp. UNOB3_S3]|uniref:energy-coupling factor transporter transmembrane component T n=1 Tax=Streptomyces sp. UNOB3_S3 TaxID=2871682 RepID=UPI001E2E7455|nr:energy-coupling factor transporter transmembrane component T [Streptomyces sp. UNOB3_S3]
MTDRSSDRSSALHAGAWWLWALGLATAASRTTNMLLLALLTGVAGYVVAARRTDAPWARSYGAFLKLGLAVIVIRLVFAVILGSPIPGTHTVLTLPEIPLPEWARGVRIGGRVTAEALVFALADGMKLATLLICVGAANALANPARLLKSLPGALYEAGVAVVVAMTFAPNLVADVQRLRAARRLRGRPDRGLKALLQVGLPVLEGALERSVALAAAMDARGYGRTAQVPPAVRRTTSALTLGGLLGVCAGTYGLLGDTGAGYGVPVLIAGLAAALAGLWLGGRRSVRTRYRPDRWGARAWLVSASGAAVAALMIRAGDYAPAALHPPAVPLTAPELPVWPAVSVLLGLLPAFVAPAPPVASREGVTADGHRRAGRRGRAAPGSAAGPSPPRRAPGRPRAAGPGRRASAGARARRRSGARRGGRSGPRRRAGRGRGPGRPGGPGRPAAGAGPASRARGR